MLIKFSNIQIDYNVTPARDNLHFVYQNGCKSFDYQSKFVEIHFYKVFSKILDDKNSKHNQTLMKVIGETHMI